MAENLYRALWSFVVCVLVTVIVSYLGNARPIAELNGLVYGATVIPNEGPVPLYQEPLVLGLDRDRRLLRS